MTRRVHLAEWRAVGPEDDPGKMLRGSTLDAPGARDLAKLLARQGVVEVTERRAGLHVRAFAHVGRITIGDIEISIVPKIGSSELLELFCYAYDLRRLRRFDATTFGSGMHLQDLLAEQLRAEVTELADRGLVKRYVARRELLATPRGRIDLDALAKRGPLLDARLTCRHHLRSVDNGLNRALLGGVRVASEVAQDAGLRGALLRLADRLGHEVEDAPLTPRAMEEAKRRMDRLSSAYEPAMRLIELLLACSAIAVDGESSVPLRGFLFDMNRFFQALVRRFLEDHLEGVVVEPEYGLTDMMRYMPGLNPQGAKAPRPRPDFAVRDVRTKQIVALLDAKYRDLWETKLPREMLYQLTVYALAQPRGATAAIVYPTMSRAAREAVVEIRDPAGVGALGFVALRPLVIPRLLEVLADAGGNGARALATEMLRGSGRLAPTRGGTVSPHGR